MTLNWKHVTMFGLTLSFLVGMTFLITQCTEAVEVKKQETRQECLATAPEIRDCFHSIDYGVTQ